LKEWLHDEATPFPSPPPSAFPHINMRETESPGKKIEKVKTLENFASELTAEEMKETAGGCT